MQQGSSATALTDEQILGMDSVGDAGAGIADQGGSQQTEADAESVLTGAAGPAEAAQAEIENASRSLAESATPPRTAPQTATGLMQDDPAWLKALEAQPAAAAEAREWRAAARDVAAMDAAYFSTEQGARAGLASRLYENDPGAFRAMLAESARVLASRDPQGLAELARLLGTAEATPQASPAKSLADSVRDARPASTTNDTTAASSAFPAEAYRTFESSTNTEVARRMNDAIDRTLRNTLPEGVAEGARLRIGDDISREIHVALANDRALTQQVGEVLRDWRFDTGAQQRVVSLLAGRARAVLPEVARRVVAEWTSSVLASDRARTARIETAASRRDVTGGRLPEPVAAATLRPRDIDYGRTSDEQILDM